MLVRDVWMPLFMQRQSKRRANCSILLRVSVTASHWLILVAVFQAIITQASKRYASCVHSAHNLSSLVSSVFFLSHSVLYSVSISNDIFFNQQVLFTQIASIVNHSIDLHFPSPDVTIIAEPGRFYVSSGNFDSIINDKNSFYLIKILFYVQRIHLLVGSIQNVKSV